MPCYENTIKTKITVKSRPPDKSVYWKTIFFISHPKHMLWVLKRTVSMRLQFYSHKISLSGSMENEFYWLLALHELTYSHSSGDNFKIYRGSDLGLMFY